MAEVIDTIQCELMLLKWSKDSTSGGILRFQVDDLEPFEAMTEAKGKRAGQRFMAVLVPIADDETAAKLPAGPLCRLAAIWCRDDHFGEWLLAMWPALYEKVAELTQDLEERRKLVVCEVCGVLSRKELDHNGGARRTFNELIRRPYAEYLATRDQPAA
jgi:hypothetical protein